MARSRSRKVLFRNISYPNAAALNQKHPIFRRHCFRRWDLEFEQQLQEMFGKMIDNSSVA